MAAAEHDWFFETEQKHNVTMKIDILCELHVKHTLDSFFFVIDETHSLKILPWLTG